ncbi:T9SS type B sorting domain-containing protein [Salinimicrobium xinjiangense]|uniref:T9SS type B sorting domain-containing protein n=1 Tax=Salinimicrobium xinjiangense TaxID=438596 RepID=UPI0004201A24|nr:T9SS type B sorting domain-containing protein [Salinimicrobium xinjiangense]
MRVPYFLVFLFVFGQAFSQLSFCPGSKGDPIFHEDFGTGLGTGAALPAGITTYDYVTGDPDDGQYTISSRIGQNNGSWHQALPQRTISNGKALIVNANDNTAGMFYETGITGLCEATTYEFSAFLMNVYNAASVNVCEGTGIPINVRFEIWDETDTVLLASGSTGDIDGTSNPQWEQYALVFRSQVGQSDVILRMFNNGVGGCGNDLAIDDIIFRSCGDLTEISSEVTAGNSLEVCEPDSPVSVELTATPNNTVYTSHAFQWQESADGEHWVDLAGETGRDFSSPQISSTTYYRIKIAEDAVNLLDDLCSSASEPFEVIIVTTPEAPLSPGDREACEGDMIPPLEVTVEADETVFWFDNATGGNQLATGKRFVPEVAGTYYAEAIKTGFSCEPGPRTAVTLTVFSSPQVTDEIRKLCSGGEINLDAGAGNFSYNWSTGASGREISVNLPGNYSVVLTNANGCSAVKEFQVRAVDVAGISKITSEGTTVIIQPAHTGEFEYSLDGINFQSSGTFENIPGGIYTAYVRDLEGCNTVSKEFPHIVLPQFITPNSDGFNDQFELKGVEYFSNSEIRIYDRYGKLLATGTGAGFSWDGSFNGRELPAEDYWYHIFIDGYEPIKGHFSLIR